MKKINSNAISMYDYNLESIKSLNAIKHNIGDLRADLLKLVYQENKNGQNQDIKKGINIIKAIEEGKIVSEVKTMANSIENRAAQGSESGYEEILNSMNEITMAVADVAKSAQNQAELAQNLNNFVERFKI
jgi:methyl-accepting chemotaxis protein